MKKVLKICAALALALTSCSERETMEQTLLADLQQSAEGYISPAKAVELANEFAENIDEVLSNSGAVSRSGSVKRHASSSKNVHTLNHVNSRSGESHIYVVDYDDNQGFALVSKKDIENPVLAFIEEGSYDAATAEKIGGFQDFVGNANTLIANPSLTWPRDTIIIPPAPLDSLITPGPPHIMPDLTYGHWIYNKWGQEGIFGKYCPNGVCGCGPLAFAMVCAYYEEPKQITLSFDGSYRVIDIDWKSIKYHKNYGTKYFDSNGNFITKYINPDEDLWPDCKTTPCTKESHDQLALLVRQIGHDMNANYDYNEYGEGTTGVRLFTMYTIMNRKYLYKANTFVPYNMISVKVALKTNQPVIFAAQTPGNHIWVCDGYVSELQNGTKGDYFHYNWGFDGEFNGFFLGGVFHYKEGWDEFTNVECSIIKHD